MGGAVLGTAATEEEAWAIYDQWPKTDCRCGCRGIVTRDGFRHRRGAHVKRCVNMTQAAFSFDSWLTRTPFTYLAP